MEHIILETIFKYVKHKKMIGSHLHGLMKGKSCLTSLIVFYDEITSSVDEERAEDANHLNFSKAFITGCHSFLINKLLTRQVDSEVDLKLAEMPGSKDCNQWHKF